MNSYLDSSFILIGKIESNAGIKVAGQVYGEVNCRVKGEVLSLGPTGKIVGRVRAEKLLLEGVVEGVILARLIKATDSFRVAGAIFCESLSHCMSPKKVGGKERLEELPLEEQSEILLHAKESDLAGLISAQETLDGVRKAKSYFRKWPVVKSEIEFSSIQALSLSVALGDFSVERDHYAGRSVVFEDSLPEKKTLAVRIWDAITFKGKRGGRENEAPSSGVFKKMGEALSKSVASASNSLLAPVRKLESSLARRATLTPLMLEPPKTKPSMISEGGYGERGRKNSNELKSRLFSEKEVELEVLKDYNKPEIPSLMERAKIRMKQKEGEESFSREFASGPPGGLSGVARSANPRLTSPSPAVAMVDKKVAVAVSRAASNESTSGMNSRIDSETPVIESISAGSGPLDFPMHDQHDIGKQIDTQRNDNPTYLKQGSHPENAREEQMSEINQGNQNAKVQDEDFEISLPDLDSMELGAVGSDLNERGVGTTGIVSEWESLAGSAPVHGEMKARVRYADAESWDESGEAVSNVNHATEYGNTSADDAEHSLSSMERAEGNYHMTSSQAAEVNSLGAALDVSSSTETPEAEDALSTQSVMLPVQDVFNSYEHGGLPKPEEIDHFPNDTTHVNEEEDPGFASVRDAIPVSSIKSEGGDLTESAKGIDSESADGSQFESPVECVDVNQSSVSLDPLGVQDDQVKAEEEALVTNGDGEFTSQDRTDKSDTPTLEMNEVMPEAQIMSPNSEITVASQEPTEPHVTSLKPAEDLETDDDDFSFDINSFSRKKKT